MFAILDYRSRTAKQNTCTASNIKKHSNATILSQYISEIKNNKVNFKVYWEIITKTKKNTV